MTYAFIVNPTAGRHRVVHIQHAIGAVADARDLAHVVHLTTHKGHAVELAEQAGHQADVVVAVGGDGTVHEVANGLVRSSSEAYLGVVPTGSGNDFARQIGMPRRLDEALEALFHAEPHLIDYGIIEVHDADGQRQEMFVNAAGIGFDAEVARRAEQDKVLPGFSGYLVTAVRTISRWQSPYVTVSLHGEETISYEGPLLMVCVGNGKSAGGGLLLTPQASVHDGWLDVCLVPGLPMRRILQLVPQAVAGRLWQAPEVRMARVAAVHVCSDATVPVHVDGEILAREAHEVQVHIRRAAFPVCIPH